MCLNTSPGSSCSGASSKTAVQLSSRLEKSCSRISLPSSTRFCPDASKGFSQNKNSPFGCPIGITSTRPSVANAIQVTLFKRGCTLEKSSSPTVSTSKANAGWVK